jgi:hypothetical protein
LPEAAHVPPKVHGLGEQGLTAVAQVAPEKPAAQVQVKALMPSVHAPPFWQGFGAQSSTFTPHVVPVKPAGQVQV